MLSDRALRFCFLFFCFFVNFASNSTQYKGMLLKFDELSMFWNILFPTHRLFYMHSTRKVIYRASHVVPSN